MIAKKRKPGASIPEAQRHTSRVVLRLPPREAERLRELAEDEGVTVSGWVASLVAAERLGGLPERLARALQEIGEAHGESAADPLHILAGFRAELEAAEAKHREIKLAVGEMWKTYLDPTAPIGTLGPAVERVAKLLGYEGFKARG